MLSAPIQTSPNPAPVTGAGSEPLLPVAADATAVQSMDAVPEAAPFDEQLSEVLTLPEAVEQEPVATELANEDQPARDGQEQSEPNAEAWLLAMLDQQQLQLQARDTQTSAATNPIAVVGLPAAPITPAVPAVAINTTAAPAATAVPIGTVINASLAVRTSQPQVMAAKPGVSQDEKTQQPNARGQDQFLSDTSVAPKAVDSRSIDNNPNAALFTSSANAVLSSNTQPQLQAQPHLQQVASLDAGPNSSQQSSLAMAPSINTEKLIHASPSQLSLQAPEAKWGEQLLHTLRDQVQVQIAQKIQNATIRLDPPELGSLEIYISHEAGRVNVHITASQADVARLIQHTSDRLRQELAGSNFTQVNVQTSAEGQSGQQQSRERQRFIADERILANEQPLVNTHQPQRRPGDVLVSV